MTCLLHLCISLLAGFTSESIPPDGTWWEYPQPAQFNTRGVSAGVGVRGENWSVTVEELGRMTSTAVACGNNEPMCTSGKIPFSHFLGSEHPSGVWANWEPHWGPVFGQLGVGLAWPRFSMAVPDWNDGVDTPRPLLVGNNRMVYSPLIGFGYSVKNVDLLVNWRLLRVVNSNVDFQGLGWKETDLSIRVNF